VVEDKLSMAHSLETRVPFMDNDLVDFAMRMPVCLKLGNLQDVIKLDENEPAKKSKYFQKTRDGKIALRKMMEAYVPAEISGGVKQGSVHLMPVGLRERVLSWCDGCCLMDMLGFTM
jgi:asparagine synthase (glutamine-hydrolysing)